MVSQRIVLEMNQLSRLPMERVRDPQQYKPRRLVNTALTSSFRVVPSTSVFQSLERTAWELVSWNVAPAGTTGSWLMNIDAAGVSARVFTDLYRLISELGKLNFVSLHLLSAWL
jgi:hypothetical protein